jgi:hypothetical protein
MKVDCRLLTPWRPFSLHWSIYLFKNNSTSHSFTITHNLTLTLYREERKEIRETVDCHGSCVLFSGEICVRETLKSWASEVFLLLFLFSRGGRWTLGALWVTMNGLNRCAGDVGRWCWSGSADTDTSIESSAPRKSLGLWGLARETVEPDLSILLVLVLVLASRAVDSVAVAAWAGSRSAVLLPCLCRSSSSCIHGLTPWNVMKRSRSYKSFSPPASIQGRAR